MCVGVCVYFTLSSIERNLHLHTDKTKSQAGKWTNKFVILTIIVISLHIKSYPQILVIKAKKPLLSHSSCGSTFGRQVSKMVLF